MSRITTSPGLGTVMNMKGWDKTTLWFKRGIDDDKPLEFDVFTPEHCEEGIRIKLYQTSAQQIVGIIQRLTGAKMVVQGQYSPPHWVDKVPERSE